MLLLESAMLLLDARRGVLLPRRALKGAPSSARAAGLVHLHFGDAAESRGLPSELASQLRALLHASIDAPGTGLAECMRAWDGAFAEVVKGRGTHTIICERT